MRIKSLLPSAFGKFHRDKPIVLEEGLNIIRGANEAGKSTLGAFILGMFYGFKKEGKTRISRSPEFDRYRPWSGSDYRGAMTYMDGGRTYRVERSFDPDWVRILDDSTGEDLTRLFSQDSRKEYDFAERHLGLSQKEFRNTVWIGQLGSAQEPGLGTEIQGKLESMLEGGAEDVSLGRALAALNEEKAKLKMPRSTKAKLDLVAQEIARLEKELADAQAREEQVRDWLVEASDLRREKGRLEAALEQGAKELRAARYRLLRGILDADADIEAETAALRERMRSLEWAGDLPPGCEQEYASICNEKEALRKRIAEVEGEIVALEERRGAALASLEAFLEVEAVGFDEAAISALHTKYLMAKAGAVRGERSANEARRDLRVLEEEGKTKGYPAEDLDEDVLRMAEDHQQNCVLAEKEKDRLDVEVERARSAVSAANAGGGPTLIYAAALVVLGLAVVSTVMAMPFSVPLFIVATAVFAIGLAKQGQASKTRAVAHRELAEKEREASAQVQRIENARKVLSESLAAIGVGSVEELRSKAREIAGFRARLASAKERFEQAQKAWFEASAALSAVEKELLGLLRSTGAIKATEPVTDAGVGWLRMKVRELQSQQASAKALEDRLSEVGATLDRQRSLVDAATAREDGLLRAAGSDSGQALVRKIEAAGQRAEAARSLEQAAARRKALLSGRDVSDIRREAERLSAELGGPESSLDPISERQYEDMRVAHDEAKSRLAGVNQNLAAVERGIRLRAEEGRPAALVEEDLQRQRALEEGLNLQRDALELAWETLSELSTGIRREFAPALNERVGAVLGGITGGRYAQVKVSPDLEMSVIHPDTSGQASISALSAGSLDQCYFALRVAIAEAITKKDEFPFFLDDSFVQYDDRRLEGALRLLSDLSSRHQVLVFSCHGREEEAAAKMGIRYHRVAL